MSKQYTYNAVLTLGGESHTISEWAKILRVPAGTIYNRRRKGWTDAACLAVGVLRGSAPGKSHPWKRGPAV